MEGFKSMKMGSLKGNENLIIEDAREVNIHSGLECLLIISALHNVPVDEARIKHQFGYANFGTQKIILAARSLGLTAREVNQKIHRIKKTPLPAIAIDVNGEYFIAGKYHEVKSEGSVLIQYPRQPPKTLALEEFSKLWTGRLILFTSKATYSADLGRFDFSWFIPAVVKYRRMLGEILLVSFILQIIALATPLFFQVVMDKVLVNQAMKTLNVIAIGLTCAVIFEVLLSAIRTWVFAHTSSKIDVELGARLFRHLLGLPLAYFQARRVGDSVARVRELENIRSFLTGNALTVVLDLLFSFVFISVMYWYSPELTVIVLLSIPVYFTISLVCTPMIRSRLEIKFKRGAENQSFLVESVSGIDTIKSSAVEPRWTDKWDKQLAAYVTSSLSVNNISNLAASSVNLVSKLVNVGIMFFGASLVIDNKLTVGQLIAFNMLAGQVSGPIVRLAQLWNDFQQVGVSMARLGDILNSPTEISTSKTSLPAIHGEIIFDNISFRYRPDLPEAIRDVSLRFQEGDVIGIVGRSGSGKSTLSKLVQRLYVPQRGRILIDGNDISTIDTSSLRQQVGVVLQENMLFNRTIRENIALTNPVAPLEAVIQAARMAGAHEFICEQSEGYDTIIGEHGTGLSGGQRQRIAIARALLGDPRILIFDEATSALDYESERLIQDNMRQICKGRTVLIVAHRLSAVADADLIVVMERGQVAEMGSHSELLALPGGIYAKLHAMQHRGSV
jgi:subfamily B ATP-binding cassette protein HlyB/CyaB